MTLHMPCPRCTQQLPIGASNVIIGIVFANKSSVSYHKQSQEIALSVTQDQMNVLILVNFSDAILERLKAISPRLRITRRSVKAASDVPPEIWRTIDVLYTG